MATQKTNTETNPDDDKLAKYLKDFRQASNYVRDNYHEKWSNFWKAYNGQRTKIGYNSISDAFIPETRTIVESLVANIAGGSPRFEYIPTDEEQEPDTSVLTELMDYYWDANHMGTKAQSWVRDSVLYGNGILHITWDSDRNMPCIDNVPLRDFFVDPAATSLENARYAGFRYLADKDQLKSEMVTDPATGESVPKYKNLEDTNPASNPGLGAPGEMDKAHKEMLLGSTTGDKDENQIEVILMYYMDSDGCKIVEIANRTTIIREVDSPYQQDEKKQKLQVAYQGGIKNVNKTIPEIPAFLPFAILRNVQDASLFYATGDVEVIIDRQETLNDVENLDMDNLNFLNNVMWRIDPAYEDMASEIESTPGIVIPLPRFALEAIQKPAITSDLDEKKQEIQEQMRRATAADEIIQGSQTSQRTTATEIQAVSTQATARFQTKVTNLESEGFAQLGSVLFRMSQIFVDEPTVVRIVGPEGITFKDFDPSSYSGYYEPHVKLDSTIKRAEALRSQQDAQLYQLIIGNPAANQQEALRMVAKGLGASDEEIKRLLTPMPPPQPPQGMPIPGQDPNAQPQQGQPAAPQDQPSPTDPQDEVSQAVAKARSDFAAAQQGSGKKPKVDSAAETEMAIHQARADFAKRQIARK